MARSASPARAPRPRIARRASVVPVRLAGRCRRARLLGQRGDRERSTGGGLEHLGGLLQRARIELDEQVHDDAGLVLVLVEAHVREELAYAVVAEGRIRERVPGLGARAAL